MLHYGYVDMQHIDFHITMMIMYHAVICFQYTFLLWKDINFGALSPVNHKGLITLGLCERRITYPSITLYGVKITFSPGARRKKEEEAKKKSLRWECLQLQWECLQLNSLFTSSGTVVRRSKKILSCPNLRYGASSKLCSLDH